MLRFRIPIRALWVTTLLCTLLLSIPELPGFFLKPPDPESGLYRFDGPVYYTIADAPKVLGRILLWSVVFGIGAFVGAAFLKTCEHPKFVFYILSTVLSLLLAVVIESLVPRLLPSRWILWAIDNAMGLFYAFTAARVTFWAALGSWITLRWALRHDPAYA